MKKFTLVIISLFPLLSLSAHEGVSSDNHKHVADSVALVSDSTINDAVYRYELSESLLSEKRPSPVRSSQFQIPVFDQKIEKVAPLQTFESALRILPSLDLRERAGKGAQADISIRGGSADQTMLMLNGVNFTDARTGHQTHSLPLDMESISSISLIRDVPGTGALSGALNVVAKGMYPNYLRSELSSGAHGYAFGNVSGARTIGNKSVFASISMRNSDGYKHNTDYRNYNAYLRGEWNSERLGYFDFQAGAQSRRFGSNGFYAAYNPDQYEYTRTYLTSLRYTKRVGIIGIGASLSYRKNYDQYEWTKGTPSNYHETDNVGADLRMSADWLAGNSVLGADLSYNHIFSSNLGEKLESPVGPNGRYKCEKDRYVSNIYARHSKQWEKIELSAMAGASLTPYGTSALWSASLIYAPISGLEIVAQSGQSSRLPTFTDLYYTSKAQINNLDLVPEKALNYNLDITWAKAGFKAGAHAYLRDTKDRIAWVWRDELTVGEKHYTSIWHSEQISRMHNYGVELDAEYTPEYSFIRRVRASYAYASADVQSPLPVNSTLDFLNHKAVLGADIILFKNCTLSALCSLCDRFGSYNDYKWAEDGSVLRDENGVMLTESVEFKPYCLLDFRLSYEKGNALFYLDATNVTSSTYCDFGGLTMPRCWVTGGIAVTIKNLK